MASGSAWTRPRRSVTCCRARARTCLSARPSIELRSSGTVRSSRLPQLGGPGPGALPQRARVAAAGLGELVLFQRFVAGDREVTVLVLAVAAAAQLEPGRNLVHGPAVFDRIVPPDTGTVKSM